MAQGQFTKQEAGAMGLDIWFPEDIRNALLAANESSYSSAALVADLQLDANVVAELRAYWTGYRAALATVALAFGVAPDEVGAAFGVRRNRPSG